MNMESLKVLVSLVTGIIGGIIGVLGYMRTKNKDTDEKAQRQVDINAEQVRHDTEIEVKYALDVKKYFDNKIAEISAQII